MVIVDSDARQQHARPVADVMISARGVSKTYESGQIQVHALRDIDFTVHRGEMVAIMGPSGCGNAFLMSWIPARQAASVPIAESLRYE
jgi:ABC-type dipeptide/oligopeptide/nickel transport system ATPase subunit